MTESRIRIATEFFEATQIDEELGIRFRALIFRLTRDLQRFAEVTVGLINAILVAKGDRDFGDD